MSLAYLTALLVSLACVTAVDLRFRLFLGARPAHAAIVLAAGCALFLAWDLAGIGLGIFLRGAGPYMTGILLAPHLPIEEPVFLLFLCEITMVLILGASRMLAHWNPRARGTDTDTREESA